MVHLPGVGPVADVAEGDSARWESCREQVAAVAAVVADDAEARSPAGPFPRDCAFLPASRPVSERAPDLAGIEVGGSAEAGNASPTRRRP